MGFHKKVLIPELHSFCVYVLIYIYKPIVKGLILLATANWDTNPIGYC